MIVNHRHLIDTLEPARALDGRLLAVHAGRNNLPDIQRLDTVRVLRLLRDLETRFDHFGARIHSLDKTTDASECFVVNHVNL